MWVRTKRQAGFHLSSQDSRHQPRTSSDWFTLRGCLFLICPPKVMPFSNWSDQRVFFFWLVNLKGAFFLIGPYRRGFFFFFWLAQISESLAFLANVQTKETLVKYPWHQGDPPLEKGGCRRIKLIKEDRLRFRRNGKFWIQSKVWNSDKLCLIFYLFLIGVPRE